MSWNQNKSCRPIDSSCGSDDVVVSSCGTIIVGSGGCNTIAQAIKLSLDVPRNIQTVNIRLRDGTNICDFGDDCGCNNSLSAECAPNYPPICISPQNPCDSVVVSGYLRGGPRNLTFTNVTVCNACFEAVGDKCDQWKFDNVKFTGSRNNIVNSGVNMLVTSSEFNATVKDHHFFESPSGELTLENNTGTINLVNGEYGVRSLTHTTDDNIRHIQNSFRFSGNNESVAFASTGSSVSHHSHNQYHAVDDITFHGVLEEEVRKDCDGNCTYVTKHGSHLKAKLTTIHNVYTNKCKEDGTHSLGYGHVNSNNEHMSIGRLTRKTYFTPGTGGYTLDEQGVVVPGKVTIRLTYRNNSVEFGSVDNPLAYNYPGHHLLMDTMGTSFEPNQSSGAVFEMAGNDTTLTTWRIGTFNAHLDQPYVGTGPRLMTMDVPNPTLQSIAQQGSFRSFIGVLLPDFTFTTTIGIGDFVKDTI